MRHSFQVERQDSVELKCEFCGQDKKPPKGAPRIAQTIKHLWQCDCTKAVEAQEQHWRQAEIDAKERDARKAAERREQLLRYSRLPTRFHDARIETSNNPPGQIIRYLQNPVDGLYICGPVGTGKTHMAACIVNDFLDNKQQVIFGGVISLLGMIQATFNGNGDEAEVIARLSTVSLLVIDDLGKEKVSEWVEQTLFRVIDNRYVENKKLIVTSNWTPDQLEQRYPTAGPALISRLAEMCRYIEMVGKDRRKH